MVSREGARGGGDEKEAPVFPGEDGERRRRRKKATGLGQIREEEEGEAERVMLLRTLVWVEDDVCA